MQYPPEESRFTEWLRARPFVGWLIGLLIIFVCLGSPALLSWATNASTPASGTGSDEILKGVGIVLVTLFIVWRARRRTGK
jgi:hypothetical protein